MSLKRQGDGRRLALEVIRAIRDVGKLACSADPDDRKKSKQFCGLLDAINALRSEGTDEAMAGFAVILTDLIGRALARTLVPEIFETREARGRFVRWKGQATSPEREEAPESDGGGNPRSPDHEGP